MDNPTIQPIDEFVLAGFQQRFEQVFGACKCAFINSNDKTKILQRVFGEGVPLTYPYATFEITSVGANHSSYNSHYFSRRGLVVNVDSATTLQTVRITPVNFHIDIEYTTNKFASVEQGSVMAFIRRWLLAARNGYLKTSVNYGRLQFGVGVTLDEDLHVPSRANITESETSMIVNGSAIIHGYISEPVMGQKGYARQFNVNGEIGSVNSQIVSSQFFAFPKQE